MSFIKRRSTDEFSLPRLKQSVYINTRQTNKSMQKSSLIDFQNQLRKLSQKPYNQMKKRSNNNRRLKTIDVNDYETIDDLRKQLRQVKQTINNKMNENHYRIQNRMLECAILNRNSQVVYQPYPIVIPQMPMYPPFPSQMSQQDLNELRRKKMLSRRASKTSTNKRFLKRRFRLAVLAVLFMVRLTKFSTKVITYRKQQFKKFTQNSDFKEQASKISQTIIKGCEQFLKEIQKNSKYELKLLEDEDETNKTFKKGITKSLFQQLVQCLTQIVSSNVLHKHIKYLYYMCRHGSYACINKFMTIQQLENISISEKNYYLQADKNLQKSQIISCLFFKILIYNALGQSWKIDSVRFPQSNKILQQNIILVTSIFYQILMDIQDDYIVNVPQFYPIGNFQKLKVTKAYATQSLTVKPGEFRKNQVISGLLNQNYLKKNYKIQKLWVNQKNQLIQIIQKIHALIVKYHKQLIKPFF